MQLPMLVGCYEVISDSFHISDDTACHSPCIGTHLMYHHDPIHIHTTNAIIIKCRKKLW